MLSKLENEKKIQGIRFGNRGPTISHLMYADDTILFFQATPDACSSIKQALGLYSKLARQQINHDKSLLVFSPNTPRQFKRFMASGFGVTTTTQLGRYLGTNIDLHQNKTEVYKEIVEKIQSKLVGWKSKLLSQAARLVLINSVIQPSPIYQLAAFKLPKKFASQIDAISTNFFWGFRGDKPTMHLLNRKKLFLPKSLGVDHSNGMFSNWVKNKYFKGNLEQNPTATSQPSWAWRSMSSAASLINDNLLWRIGKGDQAAIRSKFWWHPVNSEGLSLLDKLLWKGSLDGVYSVKAGFQTLLQEDFSTTQQGFISQVHSGRPKEGSCAVAEEYWKVLHKDFYALMSRGVKQIRINGNRGTSIYQDVLGYIPEWIF
ncbi:putative RNA-directed DNA polymerase [Senna tora]|uniref:Putative RNA-directed DNA polymerase n=1 Tax=Senna tora TaxID=362788 RepID=A0A834XDQ3_9FABA|nr:putative RNA-directed DNA polymerase [Senna tora]